MSRYAKNTYSSDDKAGFSIDLAVGNYSDFLLSGEATLSLAKVSPDDIMRHLLALSYRSMDDELSSAMRKHGIDSLRRALEKLDHWCTKWKDDKERRKNNVSQLSPENDIAKTRDENGIVDSDEITVPSSNKRLRKSPPMGNMLDAPEKIDKAKMKADGEKNVDSLHNDQSLTFDNKVPQQDPGPKDSLIRETSVKEVSPDKIAKEKVGTGNSFVDSVERLEDSIVVPIELRKRPPEMKMQIIDKNGLRIGPPADDPMQVDESTLSDIIVV